MNTMTQDWQFWIDRGGTFTDIVAHGPDGQVLTHKLLSHNPDHYQDAVIHGIHEITAGSSQKIDTIKMGTTVATNALLERTGEPTAFITTKGFKDSLAIGYQHRPEIFALNITRPEVLYEQVVEIEERVDAQGNVLTPIDVSEAEQQLQLLHASGIRSLAICLMHGYRYRDHEKQLADLANNIGFGHVSVSHEVSPLIRLVKRGMTTVVDAYLSPILYDYVNHLSHTFSDSRLIFMQSNGGLAAAEHFHGRNSILSGPAGGVVGAVKLCASENIDKIIGFDMGGTSTDVCHYNGMYERSHETEIAGTPIVTPMMHVHTIAAGGGSVLHFDGERYRVGPDSAGANPGPTCYRNDGPLTITDCNVMLGKIQPDFFPTIFGKKQNQTLDLESVTKKFTSLCHTISKATGNAQPEQVAEGFLHIAVKNMAGAIKKISVERGYDITNYTLCCFGGAGGQHACLIADELRIPRILVPANAGVLSAVGIGLADITAIREQGVEAPLNTKIIQELEEVFKGLEQKALADIDEQDKQKREIEILRKVNIRYQDTDKSMPVSFADEKEMIDEFNVAHLQRFGFVMQEKPLVVESATVEVIAKTKSLFSLPTNDAKSSFAVLATKQVFTNGQKFDASVIKRADMKPGDWINGPTIIIEDGSTTFVEPGWQAKLTEKGHLLLERHTLLRTQISKDLNVDPVKLEIFNNLFMSVAEQMGLNLQNTSRSVNIKERLDFSCALFDKKGALIANAPHIPVHLGSMGDAVQAVVEQRQNTMKPGEAYATNNPYQGGTHLPDITVITPVFIDGQTPDFYVASRGHHADIGGITPGSMPADSATIHEEGVLLDNIKILENNMFLEEEVRSVFLGGDYPARNPDLNIADLQAQVAANETGILELKKMVENYGLDVVQAYMQHVQDNAENAVRKVLGVLKDGQFSVTMDDNSNIKVTISIDQKERTATIDFSGTSPMQSHNLNAPSAICRAAILYVFRTLVDDDIPLNAGCLKPLKIIIEDGSLLAPHFPAAVAGGNVETSQCIVNALYGALGVMAAAQGTMNNVSFGNNHFQYYETLAGGAGAGKKFNGCGAVQSHMTNSRLTDPEVLEWRFPVMVEDFSIATGTGGAGKHKGGDGTYRRIRFLEHSTTSILSNSRVIQPFGLAGGQPGELGKNWIERKDGGKEQLKSLDTAKLQPGDVLCVQTPGGGGYG